jgi:hypothetical protein
MIFPGAAEGTLQFGVRSRTRNPRINTLNSFSDGVNASGLMCQCSPSAVAFNPSNNDSSEWLLLANSYDFPDGTSRMVSEADDLQLQEGWEWPGAGRASAAALHRRLEMYAGTPGK